MVFGLAGFILGTVLGSFALALADRSLGKRSFWGRSYCINCKRKLAWYDLFPILSYIFLQGKCRYCRKKIGIEYLLTEIILGVIFSYLFIKSFSNFQFSVFNFQSILNYKLLIFIFELVIKIFFVTVLAILFITDLRKMLIPDRIVKPAIIIGFFVSLAITIYKIGLLYYSLTQTVIGRNLLPPHTDYFQRHAFLAFQPFLLAVVTGLAIGGFFGGLIIITRGKGMGGGDVNLGAFIGLMLGFPMAILAIILSFLIGAVFSVGLLATGKKHLGQVVPFGPFMVAGSLIALFWGNKILDWYLKLSI